MPSLKYLINGYMKNSIIRLFPTLTSAETLIPEVIFSCFPSTIRVCCKGVIYFLPLLILPYTWWNIHSLITHLFIIHVYMLIFSIIATRILANSNHRLPQTSDGRHEIDFFPDPGALLNTSMRFPIQAQIRIQMDKGRVQMCMF